MVKSVNFLTHCIGSTMSDIKLVFLILFFLFGLSCNQGQLDPADYGLKVLNKKDTLVSLVVSEYLTFVTYTGMGHFYNKSRIKIKPSDGILGHVNQFIGVWANIIKSQSGNGNIAEIVGDETDSTPDGMFQKKFVIRLSKLNYSDVSSSDNPFVALSDGSCTVPVKEYKTIVNVRINGSVITINALSAENLEDNILGFFTKAVSSHSF